MFFYIIFIVDFIILRMKIYPIETGNFKLDGGAMFGVVPKTIWQKTNPADANNLIEMSMRCMLIEDGERLILIDTGLGDKQSEKFFGYYFLFGDFTLTSSLAKHGFNKDDITDVFLTHLHFDHCGGAIEWNQTKTRLQPVFKNAKFWSNDAHWKWATQPNPREKASFLKENFLPIKKNGKLNFLKEGEFLNNIKIRFYYGHTHAQIIPFITLNGKTLVFCADLLPSTGHIPLPYVMGYDVNPLITLKEKEIFLNEAYEKEYILFLEHDYFNECCIIEKNENKFRIKRVGKLKDFID